MRHWLHQYRWNEREWDEEQEARNQGWWVEGLVIILVVKQEQESSLDVHKSSIYLCMKE